MTPREKALNYLIGHCRHGQRTKDLYKKRAFVDLEIELSDMLAREKAVSGGNVLPMAAGFARRDEDPGANGAGKH